MESFKSHILVIDDDEGIRSLLKQFLNENGYLVNTASNALEAQEKISIIKFVRKSNINFRLPLSVFLNQFLSLRYYDICKIIYLRVERIGFSLPKSALFYICDLLDMFLLL